MAADWIRKLGVDAAKDFPFDEVVERA